MNRLTPFVVGILLVVAPAAGSAETAFLTALELVVTALEDR